MTRRAGFARLARRARVGPILPATPRISRSPSTVASVSTRARLGRVRNSSSSSTEAKRAGKAEGSRKSTGRVQAVGISLGGPSRHSLGGVANLRDATGEHAMALEKIVRIGGASGFWGDSRVAAPQLVA